VTHYVGVFIPLESGGWRALFPDVPECSVERENLDLTVLSAATELGKARKSASMPAPRSLTEIKLDHGWAASSGIDWSKAVVTMIPLRG
jgi:hypothetical protein